MKYFTEKEVQDFKDGSINYPYIVVEKEQHEVIEVSQIVGISGMANNNGTPTEIEMQVHTKGKPTKCLTYKLVTTKASGAFRDDTNQARKEFFDSLKINNGGHNI